MAEINPNEILDWRRLKGKAKYKAYMASHEWSLLREAVHKRANGICERCRTNSIDAVHHQTYERVFRELLTDLQGVCEPCHENHHGKCADRPQVIAAPNKPRYLVDGVAFHCETIARWAVFFKTFGFKWKKLDDYGLCDFYIAKNNGSFRNKMQPLDEGKYNLDGYFVAIFECVGDNLPSLEFFSNLAKQGKRSIVFFGKPEPTVRCTFYKAWHNATPPSNEPIETDFFNYTWHEWFCPSAGRLQKRTWISAFPPCFSVESSEDPRSHDCNRPQIAFEYAQQYKF